MPEKFPAADAIFDGATNKNGPEGPLHPLKGPSGVYGTQDGRLDVHLISVEDKPSLVDLDSAVQDSDGYVFNLIGWFDNGYRHAQYPGFRQASYGA